MPEIIISIAVAVVVLICLFFAAAYVKAPPNKAYIISGFRAKKRVLIGKAGFRLPFFERTANGSRLYRSEPFSSNGYPK